MTNDTLFHIFISYSCTSYIRVENMYFALVSVDLLPAKNLPSESLQLLRSILSRLSVGTYDTRSELLCQQTQRETLIQKLNSTPVSTTPKGVITLLKCEHTLTLLKG